MFISHINDSFEDLGDVVRSEGIRPTEEGTDFFLIHFQLLRGI